MPTSSGAKRPKGPLPTIVPSLATLKKYGFTVEVWWDEFKRQGEVCLICQRPSGSGRYVLDHEHVAGWKKMTPKYRRWFVRGILCSWCNSHVVGRFVTLAKARNTVKYLERYELRKAMQ